MKHMFGCAKMETRKKAFLTKADVLLLFGILLTAFMLLFLLKGLQEPGSRAVVSCDGRTILQFPILQEEAAYYLVIWEGAHTKEQQPSAKGGEQAVLRSLPSDTWAEEAEALIAESGAEEYNLFACENGEVWMIRSSCPDLICVNHRAVSETGENIICLPHKLVIEITGAQEQDLDGVIY